MSEYDSNLHRDALKHLAKYSDLRRKFKSPLFRLRDEHPEVLAGAIAHLQMRLEETPNPSAGQCVAIQSELELFAIKAMVVKELVSQGITVPSHVSGRTKVNPLLSTLASLSTGLAAWTNKLGIRAPKSAALPTDEVWAQYMDTDEDVDDHEDDTDADTDADTDKEESNVTNQNQDKGQSRTDSSDIETNSDIGKTEGTGSMEPTDAKGQDGSED